MGESVVLFNKILQPLQIPVDLVQPWQNQERQQEPIERDDSSDHENDYGEYGRDCVSVHLFSFV